MRSLQDDRNHVIKKDKGVVWDRNNDIIDAEKQLSDKKCLQKS